MSITNVGSIDAGAFEQLVRDHQAAVFSFCLRRMSDRVAAEDACAAVFYEVWRHRERVDLKHRPVRPWLIGVAVNVMRNERRSDRRRAAVLRRLPRPETPFDSTEDAVSRVDAAWAGVLLGLLSPLERPVVQACVIEGASYAEAARQLALPIGTVRSRLSRAKARMRSEVAHLGSG